MAVLAGDVPAARGHFSAAVELARSATAQRRQAEAERAAEEAHAAEIAAAEEATMTPEEREELRKRRLARAALDGGEETTSHVTESARAIIATQLLRAI